MSFDIQSCTQSFAHRRIVVVNVIISERVGVVAEIEGDHQVLNYKECPDYLIPTFSFSFDELRSPQIYDSFAQQLESMQMNPDTRRFWNHETRRVLVEEIIEYGMDLVSGCGEDDTNFGFLVNARLYVENFQLADEKELALYMQYDMDDDMDDVEDDIEDYIEDDMNYVEAHPEFKGVKKGRYNGGGGKEEVIMCSVCLEELTIGMEISRLPCSHVFHSSCVDPWLERKRRCPNCRNSLEDENSLEVTRIAKMLRLLTSTTGRLTSEEDQAHGFRE